MTEKKKLIEVALPLEAISEATAREKSIKVGKPTQVHHWWARRPLSACRAVLFASLVDDPGSRPDRFPTAELQDAERQRLFRLLERLVRWENTTNEAVLRDARKEILDSCGGDTPVVLDPFCGGGAIPLEAQRLGLVAHASDLNPVAVLLTKALIEIPPRFAGHAPVHADEGKLGGAGRWPGATGLAEDVRHYGSWVRDEAERLIGQFYPKAELPGGAGSEAPVIAWLWARTVRSPNPAWNGTMPLVRSFILSAKKGKESWIEPIVERDAHRISYHVRTGPAQAKGTIARGGATCLATGTPVPLAYVRDEAQAGRMGAELMAIVAGGPRGRIYLDPEPFHSEVALAVPEMWAPTTELLGKAAVNVPLYGFKTFGDLFTPRQLLALNTLADLVRAARDRVVEDALRSGEGSERASEYANAIVTYLAMALSRTADWNNSLSRWESKAQVPQQLFGRQAIPMVWDYSEANPLGTSTGSFMASIINVARSLETVPATVPATVEQRDATALGVTDKVVVSTDPPYYDNIGYADLSDFFHAWLRRSLADIHPIELSTLATPKVQELVATPYRFGGDRDAAEKFFEAGLSRAFESFSSIQHPDFPITVFYAFKQAEEDEAGDLASTGWETILKAVLDSGLAVNGTWPLRSEMSSRLIASGSNALASSIVLVCRPRRADAPLATRKEFLSALKSGLPTALRDLQQASIAPVDLAQAAIGPGMGVFSRYVKVVEADGSSMTVRTALSLINQVLDETLSEQEADFDSDTRWAVTWFEQNGMNPGPFGLAETLSKAKNTAVNGLVAAGIVESRGGKVRLLDRSELPAHWEPTKDKRLTVWEVCQNLIRCLDVGGEREAAHQLRMIGGLGDAARELAYRLYSTCERKRWAKEAIAYNSLVVAWPEISRLATGGSLTTPEQETLL